MYYQSVSSDMERSVVAQDYIPGSIYTLEGLSPNTAYNVCVTASTSGGEGNCASVAEVTSFGGKNQSIANLSNTCYHHAHFLLLPQCLFPLCILIAVYPPEIASVNPTTEQNTYRMTINPFNTTYGPLR